MTKIGRKKFWGIKRNCFEKSNGEICQRLLNMLYDGHFIGSVGWTPLVDAYRSWVSLLTSMKDESVLLLRRWSCSPRVRSYSSMYSPMHGACWNIVDQEGYGIHNSRIKGKLYVVSSQFHPMVNGRPTSSIARWLDADASSAHALYFTKEVTVVIKIMMTWWRCL